MIGIDALNQPADAPGSDQPLKSFKVGPDRAAFYGELLIIDARREMPDWTIREFARKPIYFRDKKYFLKSRTTAEKPYAVRYVLEPWPDDHTEVPRQFFVYGESATQERDESIRAERTHDITYHLLLPLYPLLGFLWTDTKDKLARIGFETRLLNLASLLLSFAFLLPELMWSGLVFWISILKGHPQFNGILTMAFGNPVITIEGIDIPFSAIELVFFLALLADFLVRFSRRFKNTDEAPIGFLEWLFRSK